VVLKDLGAAGWGLFAMGEMLTFLVILFVGWLFAYRRGCFEWE
jgi:NADH:ubiquinone oxidoreductase subunit 3 (subunit A)